MVVTQSFPIILRPYAGLGIPGFPIGHWVSHSGVLADATGGTIHNIINFSSTGAFGAPSLIYSLEELTISTVQLQTSQRGLMEVLGFDLLPQGGGTGGQFTWYGFNLQNVGQNRLGLALEGGSIPLPIFMGRAEQGTVARLLFEVNNLNGDSLSVKAGGYFWQIAAMNARGGVQRPPAGLYTPGRG